VEHRIALAIRAEGPRSHVYEVLSTTEGHRAFWTTDCDVHADHARFGFLQAPVDLEVSVNLVHDELVSMTVTSGFPGWNGSTWQWALSSASDDEDVTVVQFRHFGFEPGHDEDAVGFTAQSWAMILERLARFVKSGTPDPFFDNEPT
jgi:hypothetical protein